MKDIIKRFGAILIVILLQVFVFNQINLLGYGNIFVYLLIFIVFPLNTKPIPLMIIAFIIGFIIDIFSNSYGINAFAATFVAAVRGVLLRLFFSKEDLDYEHKTNLFVTFSINYYKYLVIMIFLYCFVLFALDAFSFKQLFFVLVKSIVSTFFTSIFIFFLHSVALKKYNER